MSLLHGHSNNVVRWKTNPATPLPLLPKELGKDLSETLSLPPSLFWTQILFIRPLYRLQLFFLTPQITVRAHYIGVQRTYSNNLCLHHYLLMVTHALVTSYWINAIPFILVCHLEVKTGPECSNTYNSWSPIMCLHYTTTG